MKRTYTTQQILDMVPTEWSKVRDYAVNDKGVKYEYMITRLGTNMVWVWACENYIKQSSVSFACWNGKEWIKKKRNKFIEII